MAGLSGVLAAYGGWLALAALVLAGVALAWLAALQRRVRMVTPDVRRLVRDMEGKSLDEVVQDLLGNMEFLAGRIGRLEVGVEGLSRRLGRTVQHMGIVRYNAEEEIGGEVSFALALLDGDHSGLLLTSVHTLSDCRLYARTVEQGRCAHELTEEEAEALALALESRRREPSAPGRLRRARWRDKERAAQSPPPGTDAGA
jgi:hypothetical protein